MSTSTVSKADRERLAALRQAVYASAADADPAADDAALTRALQALGVAEPAAELGELTVPELAAWADTLRAVAPKIRDPGATRALASALARAETVRQDCIAEGAPNLNALASAHYGLRSQVALTGPARRDEVRFTDQATGRPIAAIDKHDTRADIARKLGVSTDDPGFGFSDWLRGIANLGGGNKEAMSRVRATLTEGTNSQGGYLVPVELLPQYLEALVPASTLLNAGVPLLSLPQGAASFNIAQTATVPTAAWRNEAASLAASDPAFGVVTLTPRSLAFTFDVSRELLMDAINLDNQLIRIIAQAMAQAIDAAGLRGSGSAPTPTGILNNATVNAVTNGTNGATLSSIAWKNLTAAIQAILTANAFMPTDAIMAPRSLIGFANLVDTLGQPLRRPDVLQPINFAATSQIPINLTVGSSSDCTEIYLGNFARAMLYGVRETLTVIRSIEVKASTGLVSFFCHSRMDVGITYPTALAKITGVRAN